jgi:hypothetical protein
MLMFGGLTTIHIVISRLIKKTSLYIGDVSKVNDDVEDTIQANKVQVANATQVTEEFCAHHPTSKWEIMDAIVETTCDWVLDRFLVVLTLSSSIEFLRRDHWNQK